MTSVEVAHPAEPLSRLPRGKAKSGHHAKTHHLQLVSDGAAEAPQGLEAVFSQFDHSVCLHPGRRGGRFQLPEGGRVAVPEGAFGRPTESLEVAAVQPAELAGFCPPLAEQESLVSPVYALATSCRRLPCRLLLTLPLQKRPEPPLTRLRLLHRVEDSDGGEADDINEAANEWRELSPIELQTDEENGEAAYVTVEVDSTGVYVALLSPVQEPVPVTPAGGILRLRLDPLASLRVPKNAFTEPGRVDFSILPFSPERMSLARSLHRSETQDIASLSPMYNLHYDGPPCRRGLTVKLPLPEWMKGAERNEILNRLAIMSRQKPEAGWAALNAKKASVRLTRKSISFECRQPARFCLLEAASPQWLPRAALGFSRCAELNDAEPGELLLFAAFERRRWALAARLAPIDDSGSGIFDAATAGSVEWRRLEKRQPRQSEVQEVLRQLRRRRRERDISAVAAAAEAEREDARNRRVEIPLREGETLTLQMAGDFCLRHLGETRTRDEVRIQYHRRFADRTALFEIAPTARTATIASDFYDYLLELAADAGQPLDDDERLVDVAGRETLTFKGVITVINSRGEQLSNHEFTVGFRDLKAYLGLKPPPPPEDPAEAAAAAAAAAAAEAAESRKPAEQHPAWYRYYPRLLDLRIYRLKPEQARQESLQRLTAPRRNARPPIHGRESKALTRMSLQSLAGRLSGGNDGVDEAVALAAELGLPDSAVSVLSFESAPLRYPPAAASIAYRVLLYWKRAAAAAEAAGNGETAADSLANALERIGRRRLARLLRRCDAEGRELTPERLAAAEESPDEA